MQFNLSNHPQQINALQALVGQTGILSLHKLAITGADTEEHLVFVGVSDNGEMLNADQMRRLFSLNAVNLGPADIADTSEQYEQQKQQILGDVESRYAAYFEQEMEKLDHWADDKRKGLKFNLKDLDTQIKDLKRQIRGSKNLPEKLAFQRKAQKLEKQRDAAWREYDEQAREVEQKKDSLLDIVEQKLQMNTTEHHVFSIRWSLI